MAPFLTEFQVTGWQAIDMREVELSALLRDLTRSIGQVTSSSLTVKSSALARPNTLSAKHGTGSFPHHTDFAFRGIPPRAILLVNSTDRDFERPSYFTDILALAPEHLRTLKSSAWKLKTREGVQLVGGEFMVFRRNGFRWDSDVLVPSNGAAEAALSVLGPALSALQHTFVWRGRTALLIDNWRLTHARGDVPGLDDQGIRELHRYEVWQHAGLD
jgi:alpha-ketoglutarate-dependent taurine dioxygenase